MPFASNKSTLIWKRQQGKVYSGHYDSAMRSAANCVKVPETIRTQMLEFIKDHIII